MYIYNSLHNSDRYLATCEQASTRTDSKSLANSGPFFLLFWITSLARYRKVSFLLVFATGQGKYIYIFLLLITVTAQSYTLHGDVFVVIGTNMFAQLQCTPPPISSILKASSLFTSGRNE